MRSWPGYPALLEINTGGLAQDSGGGRPAGLCSAAAWLPSIVTAYYQSAWVTIVWHCVPSTGKRLGIETRLARVLLAGTLLLTVCESLAAAPTMSVYVADEFARVRPRDGPGSKRAAFVSAARNEYAHFRLSFTRELVG
jgi:hypothetical protein